MVQTYNMILGKLNIGNNNNDKNNKDNKDNPSSNSGQQAAASPPSTKGRKPNIEKSPSVQPPEAPNSNVGQTKTL